MSKVAASPCSDYVQDKVREAIENALSLIGINSSFFENKKVLLKPNLLGPFKPEEAVTTHPFVIKGIIEIIKNGGGTPIIAESPGSPSNNTEKVFKITGVKEISESMSVELIDLASVDLVHKALDNRFVTSTYIPQIISEVDIILSLPKFKTHSFTTFTGAMKNMFGTVPGNLKTEFHRKARRVQEFSEAIVDVFGVVKPHLSIMDAVIGMEGDGPSAGMPKKIGYILASTDAVSLDAVCIEMMGLRWDSFDMVKIADDKKLGIGNINKIQIEGTTLEEIKLREFRLPKVSYIEKTLNEWIYTESTYGWLKPRVTEKVCTGCTTCYKGCPVDAIEMVGNVPCFDYEKCIRCYCCQELCPEHAIELKVDRSKQLILKTAGGVSRLSRLTRQVLTRIKH